LRLLLSSNNVVLHIHILIMSLRAFEVTEHTIASSHVREYAHATASGDDDVLQLAVKQYTPKKSFKGSNAVTIIGAHANGFPKVD